MSYIRVFYFYDFRSDDDAKDKDEDNPEKVIKKLIKQLTILNEEIEEYEEHQLA